ncbi:MAG: hypothetical protein GTN76_09115 [Candidatus Aenigmarchaeota archaeon]|nr:hypothetical protein [Candidatus Aenigmarchaeota archaeon]
MTEDTLSWLFSTIAQTYGAIVGIMGMLTVYRLQTLSRYREDCRKRAEGSAHDVLDYEVEACGLSPEDLVEKWQHLPQEQNESKTKASTENVQIVDKIKSLKP